jgi:hypothetical protein
MRQIEDVGAEKWATDELCAIHELASECLHRQQVRGRHLKRLALEQGNAI